MNVNYPDKTQKTAQCVLVGGVWVGTVEGSSATGSYTNGYTVLANGTDENGNPVSGYVLGRGDVEILKEDGTPIADDPTHFVTDDELEAAISSKAEISDVDDVANDLADLSNSLSDYYLKTETSSAVELDAKFETKADLSALNEVADSLSDYYTKTETSSATEIQTALNGKQPAGDYALTSQLPTKTSELSNDSGYITSAQVEPSTVLGMTGYAANSEYATKIKAVDIRTTTFTDRGIIIPSLNYDSATNTYMLDLYGSVAGYHPWILRRLFGTDFSPVITLEWRKGSIYRKRVAGSTVRWSTVYSNNWMWLAKGQYAITCPTGDGKPDGKFYVLNYEDETHPNYINDPATDVHTITYNDFNITSIDGQAGGQYEQTIWCTRLAANSITIWERPFAYRNELSTKADVSALNAVESALSNYYTKNETSSAVEIETALNNVSVDLSEYYTKSETSSATEIQTALDGKQPTGNYLTAHQSLSNYYTKSETSSNVEISAALNLKQDILTDIELSALDDIANEYLTIVKYDDNTTSAYTIVGTLSKSNISAENKEIVDVKAGKLVTSIGNYAFEDCTYLTSFTMPDSVTFINQNTFRYCNNLTNLEFSNNISSIGSDSFAGCTSLTSVVLPENLVELGSNVFTVCTGITEVVVPKSIASIGATPFYGCTNLTSVVFEGKTMSQVQAIPLYPWGLNTSIIKTYNVASQEWVLEQLSALEARIAALENN